MILAVANTKGGVGKTTLAVNLTIARALEDRDVLLVDADEQGSAADFTQLRTDKAGDAGYTAMRLKGREVRSEIEKLRSKFDDIIIDVGGRDNEGLRAALTTADKVLVPVQPSSFDVWSFDRINALVNEAKAVNPKLLAVAILNAADPQGQDLIAIHQISRRMRPRWQKFIAGATTPPPTPSGKRVAALIRFDARLLKRIDEAAEKRGISRAAWLQFIASRALDAGEG